MAIVNQRQGDSESRPDKPGATRRRQNEHGRFGHDLVEVADGVFAYLQPDGTWGWSNAGLVAGRGESVLVDTLFDLCLTRTMLDEMAPVTGTSPITQVLNTHANGDHCYGNQLVAGPGVDIIASAAASAEMDEVPPAMVEGAGDDILGEFITHAFGSFEFGGIEPVEVTVEFSGRHEVDAGGRQVEMIEVGPAHTAGDVIAWLPEELVVFTGDILFKDGTPIMWSGPVANWIAALDRIAELEPEVVVPGHGPLTDAAGTRAQRDYLALLAELTTGHHEAGVSLESATRAIDAHIDQTPYAEWSDRERIVVNVLSIWRELEPSFEPPDVLGVFQLMAEHHRASRATQA